MKLAKGLILALLSATLFSACSTFESKKPAPVTPVQKPKAVIALALGGGASKGFAHIGVIKVLEENNIPISVVTGTSAGAVVGSMYAYGMSSDRLELEAELIDQYKLADFTLSTTGFIKGEKLQQLINQKVKNQPIQSFKKKFGVVATELDNGKMIVFRSGNAGQAVRASASVPNVFQPAVIGNKKYVDGGLTAPVPVIAAKNMGANVIIAVDISQKPTKLSNSGFFSYLDQSLNIMSTAALNNELKQATVVIRPQVQKLGSVGGFDQRTHAIQLGEQAARAALPQIKAALANYRY